MVSSRASTHGTADIHLQIGDGEKFPLRIATNPETGFGYRPGWTPMLVQPVRQDGFNYRHVSPEYDIILTYDTWTGGCGWVDDPELSNLDATIYSHSQGIDPSWEGRLYLSPLAQSYTVPYATPITYYSNTTLGLFACAGRYLYLLDLSSKTWVEKVDLGSGNAFTGSVAEFNGVVYAPCGSTVAYRYSTDGTTWLTSNAADPYAKFFTARGRTSTTPQFWKVDGSGNLKVTTDPKNSGVAWSSAVPTGHTSETVNGLLTANDKLWVFKKEGIYSYDGTDVKEVFKSTYTVSQNGKNPYLWPADGNVYVSYGDNLMQLSPYDNTYTFLWPLPSMTGHPELNGTIRGSTGDSDAIYVDLRNREGKEYLLKYTPRGVWHTLAYDDTLTSDAIYLVGPEVGNSTNPVLVRSAGNTSTYYIMPRTGSRPEDDTEYQFVSSGTIVGAQGTVGALTIHKSLNGGRLLTSNTSASKTVSLYYNLDDEGYFPLATSTGAGLIEVPLNEDTQFAEIRYKIEMNSADSDVSPVCHAAGFNTIVLPIRRKMWSIDIVVSDHLMQSGGGEMHRSARQTRAFLDRILDRRVTFYDREGAQFIVRVLNNEANTTTPLLRSDATVYTLTMVEITEIPDTEDIWVWGRDGWGSVKPWGDS